MKVLNKKIKAFTVSEMLVVLVISGIVISLTMLILSLVQKQISTISTNYDQNTEVQLLERTLWLDINKHALFYDHIKKQLHCVSEIDTVTYFFTEDYIVRNADTLDVPIPTITVYLNGDMIKNRDIDAIELTISKETPDKKLFIYKMNDASFFVNNNGI